MSEPKCKECGGRYPDIPHMSWCSVVTGNPAPSHEETVKRDQEATYNDEPAPETYGIRRAFTRSKNRIQSFGGEMTWTHVAIFAAGFISYPLFFYALILVFGQSHERDSL